MYIIGGTRFWYVISCFRHDLQHKLHLISLCCLSTIKNIPTVQARGGLLSAL